MNLDIAFGQYCEGRSIIHRLDPRLKILISLFYIVDVFITKNVYAFLMLTLFTFIVIFLSGINAKILLRGLKPLVLIIAFTSIINIFWFKGETLIVDFLFIHIYIEGILNAFFIVLRVILLLAGTSLFLTYTTTPIALTDGLEQLLMPLSKIKVPVHDFSMMMTIALRFIPTLIEETQKIMNAQKARGADFSSGGLIKRAKALIPVLVPLFVSAFRRAEELATAMECRCYTGGEGRTKLNVLKASSADFMFLAATVLLGAVLILLNRYAPGYSVSFIY